MTLARAAAVPRDTIPGTANPARIPDRPTGGEACTASSVRPGPSGSTWT